MTTPETASRPSAAPVSAFYRAVRAVVRAALANFYRTIEVTGATRIDPSRPTILACNHPNSIIDPLLLGTLEDRQVCFCARDGLFRIPGFGALLRTVGAVPLRRRSDHGGGTVDNAASFAACRAVLLAGGVMAIFPEGKTHSRLRIEPLKTGTTRIALDAVSAAPALGLRIVPVGITYLVRHAFLSDVHVAVGDAIDVAAAVREAGDDPVRALTARLEQSLRALSVHVESTEDERLVAQVTAIVAGIRAEEGLDVGGQSPAERTALVQRVVDAYRWAMESDPESTLRLRERIESYMDERAALGMGGELPALQHRGERQGLTGARWWAFLVLGAPVAAYGFAVSLVPYAILRAALATVRLSSYRVALFKLLGGACLFAACWAVEIALMGWRFGALAAVVFALTLAPAALFAHRYVTETRLHRVHVRSVGAWWQEHRVARLRAERASIAEALAALRKRYLTHVEATGRAAR